MFGYWGEQSARDFLQSLADAPALLVDGNNQAVRLVASGAADICMTDTDDVWVVQGNDLPIDLIYPRIGPNGPAVWIPCAVARGRGGPNPEAARKLIDCLVSAQVERSLAQSDSPNAPVRSALREQLGLKPPSPEPLDFERAADALPRAMGIARDILLR